MHMTLTLLIAVAQSIVVRRADDDKGRYARSGLPYSVQPYVYTLVYASGPAATIQCVAPTISGGLILEALRE